jgi:hypothetical protein
MANERIEILIDSDTLEYSLSCEHVYIEDVYIVLRELVHSLETGDIAGTFLLEDTSENSAVNMQKLVSVIRELKQRIDEAILKEESIGSTVQDFRN